MTTKKKIVLHKILVFEDVLGNILVVEDFLGKILVVVDFLGKIMEVLMVDKDSTAPIAR